MDATETTETTLGTERATALSSSIRSLEAADAECGNSSWRSRDTSYWPYL